jgi:hypothetical protein
MFVAPGPVTTGATQTVEEYRQRKVALITGELVMRGEWMQQHYQHAKHNLYTSTGITGQDGSYLTELLLEKGEFATLEDC